MFIKCAACNKDLVEIIVTNPDLDVSWTFQADCPLCGGKSYLTDIQGDLVIADTKHVSHVDTESKFVTKYNKTIHYLKTIKTTE